MAIIADGLIVSYGKGGTGHTKRTAQGAFGLDLLGYGSEVRSYFEKTVNTRLKDINGVLDKTREGRKYYKMDFDVRSKTLAALFNR